MVFCFAVEGESSSFLLSKSRTWRNKFFAGGAQFFSLPHHPMRKRGTKEFRLEKNKLMIYSVNERVRVRAPVPHVYRRDWETATPSAKKKSATLAHKEIEQRSRADDIFLWVFPHLSSFHGDSR